MPRFFLSGQGFKMRKFCTLFLFFLNFLSENFGFFYFPKPNLHPKKLPFLPKFSSETVLIWFQKILFSVFAQRKWVTDGGKLKLIRRVKVQKKNSIPNVQLLPSAPLLATLCCAMPIFCRATKFRGRSNPSLDFGISFQSADNQIV